MLMHHSRWAAQSGSRSGRWPLENVLLSGDLARLFVRSETAMAIGVEALREVEG